MVDIKKNQIQPAAPAGFVCLTIMRYNLKL